MSVEKEINSLLEQWVQSMASAGDDVPMIEVVGEVVGLFGAVATTLGEAVDDIQADLADLRQQGMAKD